MKLTVLSHLSPDLANVTPSTTENLTTKKLKSNPIIGLGLSGRSSNFAYFTSFENIVLRILRIHRTIIKLTTEKKKNQSATSLWVQFFSSDEQSMHVTVMVYHSLEQPRQILEKHVLTKEINLEDALVNTTVWNILHSDKINFLSQHCKMKKIQPWNIEDLRLMGAEKENRHFIHRRFYCSIRNFIHLRKIQPIIVQIK